MAETHPAPARNTVGRAGAFALGNAEGTDFAVSRKCRHLRANLDEGSVEDGCLVCPWHGAAYDVQTGRMVRGPGGVFAKVPGLGAFFKALTRVVPLAVATVRRTSDGTRVTIE